LERRRLGRRATGIGKKVGRQRGARG